MNKQQEPRLRFKGFTGAWEEKVLGEVTEYLSDGTHFSPKSQNGEYKYITSKNIRNSGLDLSDVSYISAEEHQEIYKRCSVKFGDLLLTKDGASTGNCCINFLDEEFSLLSSVAVLRPKQKKHNANFLCQVLQSPIGQNEIKGSMAGQAITRITLEKLRAYKFNFPLYEEQTHLGLFFRRLDSQIAESRAVLEKSRQLKKAMLAKMFPANGEKIPKIRFKGFEGEWECRKLGIEVEIIGGGTPDTTNSAYWNGDIDWYSPTEIGEAAYANGSVKKITLLGLQKSSAQILPANRTVLFTSRASIGDMAILTKDGSTNQGFQSFVVGERLDVYFFYAMGFKIKDYALKNASGSTFLEISKNTLSQMEFFVPSLKEQTQIGNFFRQLDETIALQSAEVEKLNQLKKGLLAAMLV
ncbi:restriction endonuclease subunit S [Neisseria sp. HMSC075C12]|uniref:restriction endonuclease subunit S n=1 Tax=Neisseria sp. HMSC075C12 TaxID=1739282 RepID=UPI0008A247CE|nr:restriction endonuclease subunit S [Neisseria sp. HMSC075C12]OFL30905.1 hypothetical protein HMPREF2778_08265 [Neisseria sp. HMSC075C12]